MSQLRHEEEHAHRCQPLDLSLDLGYPSLLVRIWRAVSGLLVSCSRGLAGPAAMMGRRACAKVQHASFQHRSFHVGVFIVTLLPTLPMLHSFKFLASQRVSTMLCPYDSSNACKSLCSSIARDLPWGKSSVRVRMASPLTHTPAGARAGPCTPAGGQPCPAACALSPTSMRFPAMRIISRSIFITFGSAPIKRQGSVICVWGDVFTWSSPSLFRDLAEPLVPLLAGVPGSCADR